VISRLIKANAKKAKAKKAKKPRRRNGAGKKTTATQRATGDHGDASLSGATHKKPKKPRRRNGQASRGDATSLLFTESYC